MKNGCLALSLIILFSTSVAHAQSYSDIFTERLCERVERRFGENTKMLKRVNRRIVNRLNFSCIPTPEVKEVISTGTRRIEVVFSESVLQESALDRSNYTITERNAKDDPQEYHFPIYSIKLHRTSIRIPGSNIIQIVLDANMLPHGEMEITLHDIEFLNGATFSGKRTFESWHDKLP